MDNKGYIIVSIGNKKSEDLICAEEKVFLSKKKALKFCKELQKEYDLDNPENPYMFKLKEIEIII